MEWMKADDPILALERKVMELHEELATLRAARVPEPVEDWTFESPAGSVSLSSLFGDRDELMLVHNMGRSCPYCTLWADGFNGVLRHLESRCAFVVVSPDPVEAQVEHAASRSWRFRMVSDGSRDFTNEMGFLEADRSVWPGISTFFRDPEGRIFRKNRSVLGPGDDFCVVWQLFTLLDKGVAGWEPS